MEAAGHRPDESLISLNEPDKISFRKDQALPLEEVRLDWAFAAARKIKGLASGSPAAGYRYPWSGLYLSCRQAKQHQNQKAEKDL